MVNCYLLGTSAAWSTPGPTPARRSTARAARGARPLDRRPELVIVTHQHIGHLGLVEIIIGHSAPRWRRRVTAGGPGPGAEPRTVRGRAHAAQRNLRGGPRAAGVSAASAAGGRRDDEAARDGGEIAFRDTPRPCTGRPRPLRHDLLGRRRRRKTTARPHLLNPLLAARSRPAPEPALVTYPVDADSGMPVTRRPATASRSSTTSPDRRPPRQAQLGDLQADRESRAGCEARGDLGQHRRHPGLPPLEVIGHTDLLVNEGRVREVQAGGDHYEATG